MSLTGDTFDFQQGNVVTSSAQIVDPGATVGDVLTVQTDKSIAAAPGGGSQTVTRAQYDGFVVSIADGATGSLTWDEQFGDSLMVITAPALPTIVTAGVYAVTANVSPAGAMAVGGSYDVQLDLDLAGADSIAQVTSPSSIASKTNPLVSVTAVYYIPAAGQVRLRVTSHDGAGAIDFSLTFGQIQRLA